MQNSPAQRQYANQLESSRTKADIQYEFRRLLPSVAFNGRIQSQEIPEFQISRRI